MRRHKRFRFLPTDSGATESALRTSYMHGDPQQDRLDVDASDAAHLEEVRRLMAELARHAEGSPVHTSAKDRLDLITGKRWQAWVKFKLAWKGFARRGGHELVIASLLPLRLLLIVVVNLLAALLFMGLLWLL